MEELQNLATFLISGGCDWINGETIAMDGAQALGTGGNFYQLREWSDEDWTRARESIVTQNAKDRAAGVMRGLRWGRNAFERIGADRAGHFILLILHREAWGNDLPVFLVPKH